jgi:hypothetical protein
MDILVISSWQESKRWVGEGAWTRGYLADCLQACTDYREVETKRLARRLFAKEVLDIPVRSQELASRAVHVLESMGATVVFRSE